MMEELLSWEDLFNYRTSPLSGVVTSNAELEKLINYYEYGTSSRFRTLKTSKNFGKKTDLSLLKTLQIRFSDTQENSQPYIDYDGHPFVILGKKILECHQGPDRDRKKNKRKSQKYTENSDHTYRKTHRRVLTSKKKGCPAKVKIRHVLKILGYQEHLEGKDFSKYWRNKVTSQIKEDLSKGAIPAKNFEHRFYVQFPEAEDHHNHLKGEASSTLQPMDKRLSEYIKKVVAEHGVTSTLKMKLLLEVFVKESLFKDTAVPPKHNKRFWPSLKDIYNHMATQMLKLRDSCIDQQLVQEMVKREKSSHPSDKFFIRIKNDESESILDEPDESDYLDEDVTIKQKPGSRNRFLYVHQTKWQQQLLKRYGNEICLLDATYRTTRYSLPLYFLCVPTNVNYMTVATFIVETEDTSSIHEALSVIKAWNLDWRPAYFMCDYANEEINAVESVFPESFVYLCDFHREQSWERWMKASHNGIGDAKADILCHFRSIAHSKTVEEYERAKASLEIKCSRCRRRFHFKPFCIEDDLADIKEAEQFRCRLCRINFWTQEECQYDLRKHPVKKRKRSSFLYSDIQGRYTYMWGTDRKYPKKRKDQSKDEKRETMETDFDNVIIERQEDNNDTNSLSKKSSTTCSSVMNTEFITRHVNSIVNTLQDIMNCTLTECDEVEHKRHHQFIENPEKVYRDNYVTYCFGSKYIQPEELEYLHQILSERMCTSKFLPGSIFSKYSRFTECVNQKLEEIFIAYPLMGQQYLKFVVIKEAVVYLVCQSTGLPYEEADRRCCETEMTVSEFRRGTKSSTL